MGMEFRPYYLSREWVKMGHRVRIISATYSHLRKSNHVASRDFEIESIDGIEYQWIKTEEYSGNGVKRAGTMWQFCKKIYKKAKAIADEFNPDVVISSSTYTFDTYPAQKIAKFAKCKYIHEAHDLWPLTLIEVAGMSEYHPFVVALAIAERSAYKKSNEIISLFPNADDHMIKHGMQSREKFHCIPNGIFIEEWESPDAIGGEHKELIYRLHSEGKFVVGYLGGHGIPNALDYLVDAAEQARQYEDIAFVLVGSGMEKDNLKKRAMGYGLDNIYFLPQIEKTKVPALMAEMDALYIGAARCSLYRFGVSMNKVYDYMMSGKPIIYGVEASNSDVRDAGCGITIEPENPKAIVSAVNELKAMPTDERIAMGNRGKDFVMTHNDYRVLAENFIDIICKQ